MMKLQFQTARIGTTKQYRKNSKVALLKFGIPKDCLIEKLTSYNSIKDKFRQETCLQLTQKWNQRRAVDLAKHRMSEHN